MYREATLPEDCTTDPTLPVMPDYPAPWKYPATPLQVILTARSLLSLTTPFFLIPGYAPPGNPNYPLPVISNYPALSNTWLRPSR